MTFKINKMKDVLCNSSALVQICEENDIKSCKSLCLNFTAPYKTCNIHILAGMFCPIVPLLFCI